MLTLLKPIWLYNYDGDQLKNPIFIKFKHHNQPRYVYIPTIILVLLRMFQTTPHTFRLKKYSLFKKKSTILINFSVPVSQTILTLVLNSESIPGNNSNSLANKCCRWLLHHAVNHANICKSLKMLIVKFIYWLYALKINVKKKKFIV